MPDPARELMRLAMERFGNLLPGEAKMLRAAAEGIVADVADREGDEKLTRESAWGCWEEWGEHRKIRAELLRWVLVHEEAAGLVHEHGVLLEGARIDGKVDLQDARVRRPILWTRCAIEEGLVLSDATLPCLYLDGSHMGPLAGNRMRTDGSVHLCKGLVAKGEVQLLGAKIGGDLVCDGSTIENPPCDRSKGRALSAGGVCVTGSVFLRNGMAARGEIRLRGAKIGGVLSCSGSTFTNPPGMMGGSGYAVYARRCEIRGAVLLRPSKDGVRTRAEGAIDMLGADILGDIQAQGLDCHGAFSLDGAQVAGAFQLDGDTNIKGSFDLSDARVARIHDAKGAWTDCTRLNLNGFRYGSFTDECEMSVEERLAWIERGMRDASRKFVYSPLPYRQLAGVYAATGQTENCVIVRQEQYRKLREHERPSGVWPPTKLQGWLRWFWRVVIDKAIGCGYAPLRPMWFMFGLWLLGCVVFNQSDKAKLFAPASDQVLTSTPYVETRTLPPDYQPLNAWLYSADTMLPIIDFHQERFWLPAWGRGCSVLGVETSYAGTALRYYLWFHIALGWMLSTLLAIGLSGLVRDEESGASDE